MVSRFKTYCRNYIGTASHILSREFYYYNNSIQFNGHDRPKWPLDCVVSTSITIPRLTTIIILRGYLGESTISGTFSCIMARPTDLVLLSCWNDHLSLILHRFGYAPYFYFSSQGIPGPKPKPFIGNLDLIAKFEVSFK